jgi:hypothetical protein
MQRNQRPQPDFPADEATLSRREFIALAGASAVATVAAGGLLAACAPADPGYRVAFMMAVQSIQDANGHIPLVSNKRTIIRVFPQTESGHADVANISGDLRVFAGDTNSGSVLATLLPLGAPITSHAAVNPDRLDHSLDFEIPLHLIDGSDITVDCELSSTGRAPWQAGAVQTLHLQRITSTELLLPIMVHPTHFTAPYTTMADYQTVLNGVLKRLPVSATRYILNRPQNWQTDRSMTSADDFNHLSSDIAWSTLGVLGTGTPTAVVPAAPSWGGGVTGVFYDGGIVHSVLSFTSGGPVSLDIAETSFAHEFTHHYGLGHAAGCDAPLNVDPSLPQWDDMTGMDVPQHRVLPHGTTPELMTYCGTERWPSSTTYNRVLAAVR